MEREVEKISVPKRDQKVDPGMSLLDNRLKFLNKKVFQMMFIKGFILVICSFVFAVDANLLKITEIGVLDEQNTLEEMHAEADVVKTEEVEAFEWIKSLAEEGNSDAQFLLGEMYIQGYGVKKNITIAKEWYKKSCDNGTNKGCKFYADLD